MSRCPPSLPSVLIVDDFVDGRELLAEYLTFRGFPIHVASDGGEAIEVARRVRPAIILMDLSMPGIDGWQATRTLKADPVMRETLIFAVTARALRPERDAAKEAGCDGVICKPFDITVLGDALPRVLVDGPAAIEVPGLSLPEAASDETIRRPNAAEY